MVSDGVWGKMTTDIFLWSHSLPVLDLFFWLRREIVNFRGEISLPESKGFL